MSSFQIEPDKINAVGSTMDDVSKELRQISREIGTIKNNLDVSDGSTGFLKTAMTKIQSSLESETSGSKSISEALRETVQLYDRTDKMLAGIEIEDNRSLFVQAQRLMQRIREWILRLLELIGFITGGSNDGSAYAGDPVNVCTGNYVSDIQEIRFPGQTSLAHVRHYNSLYLQEGPMGHGWTHNYEIRLEQREGILDLTLGDQWRERFAYDESGVYISLHNRYDCISISETEKGDIREYIYIHESGRIYRFDPEGNVTGISLRNGRGIDFAYEDGRLATARDTGGRALFYTYDSEGHLAKVADHTGRAISMEYSDGNLVRVISADGRQKCYTYDESGRLQGITNNAGIMVIWNDYDDENRVVFQRLPNHTTMSYSYDGDEVTVIDRNGAITTYRHNNAYQITDVIRSDGTKSFVYDENHQRTEALFADGGVYRKEYDQEGNVAAITDPMGCRVELKYARKGIPSQILEKNGGIIRMEYDEDGNVISQEDAVGNVTRFVYERGLMAKVIHPDLSETLFDRDENGNIIRRVDEEGRTVRFSYDEAGRVAQRTDPGDQVWSYTYDPCDRILAVKNPAGDTREYGYSETGKISSVRDFDGTVRQWSYNELDLVSSYVDQNGSVTGCFYDESGNMSEIHLPNGGRISHRYDGYNRRISTVDELGLETSFAYDAEGRLVREKAGEYSRSMEYDLCGRLVKLIEKDGSASSATYDALGHVTQLVRADGSRFTYAYDLKGRCTKRTDAAGTVTEYQYDERDRLVRICGNGTELRRYAYYADGRLKTMRTADGKDLQYTYDAAGNLVRTQSGTGYVIEYSYDCLHRRTSMRDSAGRKAYYAYDAAGHVTEHADAKGRVSHYTYSASGKLESVEDARGTLSRYEYDEMDLLAGIFHGEGSDVRHTVFVRNARGQLTKILDAEGNEDRYAYDEYGHLILHETPEAVRTAYTYDAMGRTKSIAYGDGRNVQFRYDAMGRMAEMTDWNGRMEMEYDLLGNPTRIADAAGNAMLYRWDSAGRRSSVQYPDGAEVGFYRDGAGRLEEIRTDAGTIRYEHDPFGRLLSKKAEQGSTRYAYTPDGRVREIVYCGRGGQDLALSLRYDDCGNVAEKTIREGSEGSPVRFSYEYDELGRVTAVFEDGEPVRAYGYDRFGNRTYEKTPEEELHSEYNRLNQLVRQTVKQSDGQDASCTGEQSESFWTYNKDGHVVTARGKESSYEMKYDAAGQIAEVTDRNGNRASYRYDGLGTRCGETLSKDSLVTEKVFLRDLTQPHSPVVYMEEEGKQTDFIHDGEITGALSGGRMSFYQCDQQGSVLRYLSGQSAVQEYRYDEFGRDLLGTAGQGQPFGYTGLPFDAGLEGWQTSSRTYSPQTGRFLQQDMEQYIHIMKPETINLYAYCLNNPLLYVDPDGTDCYYFYLPEWENEALADQQMLADQYGYGIDQVHLIPVHNNQDMTDGWAGMGMEGGQHVDIDTVVINTHANPYELGGNTRNFSFDIQDINALDPQSMDQLILYGCNAGHLDYQNENVANAFSGRVNGAPVLASDGSVSMRQSNGEYIPRADNDPYGFMYWVRYAGSGRTANSGWQIYQQVDGETVVTQTGMFGASVVAMLDSLRSYTVKENAE